MSRGQHSTAATSRSTTRYRNQSYISVQLRRSYSNVAHEHGVHEQATVTDLLRMFYMDISADRSVLLDKLHYEFYLHGQRMVATDEMTGSLLRGGETVYVKVFDDSGVQYLWDRRGWEPKA